MFKNVVALVTGAVNGLGHATATRLLNEKATVIACDIRADKQESVNKGHPNYQFFQADTRSEEDITRVLDHIKEKQGKLDVVVNCAGMAIAFRVIRKDVAQSCSYDDALRVMNVNVTGTFNVNRLSAQLMSENKPDSDGHRGILINTSGFLATKACSSQSVIAGTYGAINSMTSPMSQDLKSLGIRVVTISPGLFVTPLTSTLDDKISSFLESVQIFPNRFGYASEYTDLVVELIENKLINGEVVKIDAGIHLPMYL